MSLLKTVSEKLSAWRRYRETIKELAQLSDHELHDIGVHRWEIEYIARSPSAGKITARSSHTSSSTKPDFTARQIQSQPAPSNCRG
jgi:uncharacterized protein YjiS (DUF1127 family)